MAASTEKSQLLPKPTETDIESAVSKDSEPSIKPTQTVDHLDQVQLFNQECREAKLSPGFVPQILTKFTPFFIFLGRLIDILEPIIVNTCKVIHQIWRWLEPLHPEEFVPAIYGIILVFFGGIYMTTMAAIEAFRLFGWDKVKENLVVIYENYHLAKEASDRDDLLDEDGDGIFDVLQISRRDYLTRKARVFLKAVEPEKLANALNGLAQGWVAVLATLKVQFAQAITIGTTIGDIGDRIFGYIMRKCFFAITPDDYDKWVPTGVKYFWRCFGMFFAWYAVRVIKSFYSSFRGAEIFILSVSALLIKWHVLSKNYVSPGSISFTILMALIAIPGFWWQLSHFYIVPFPLNIILFPLTFIEWLLTFVVSITV